MEGKNVPIWSQERALSSASGPGGTSPGSSPEKGDTNSYSPGKSYPLFWTHSSRPEQHGGRGEFQDSLCDQTASPSSHPNRHLAPAKGRGLTLLAFSSPPQKGPAIALASPPDPQEGKGSEPFPTENSHFLAARFRNTPGLMPSGELCNQGHRSRAKQTRLCVCSGGPGGAHRGREGLRPGLGSGLFAQQNRRGQPCKSPGPPRSRARR